MNAPSVISTRRLLNAKQAANFLGLSLPGLWKAVRQGRIPKPVYPLARAPRWFEDELCADVELTRASRKVAA